ncbi:MAG: hypothetical protein CGW95_08360 [Phenylobacterium zucineum]|nr:MAG: hypothetical protein CGW95_08360 [Phenylobacterium zucineum]
MTTVFAMTKFGLAGLMALTALTAAPSLAAAQPSTPYGSPGYDYDPCRRETIGRSTVGGIVGALAGAAIGSNIAGRGVRKEGAVLGALAGTALGVGIGHSSAACRSAQQQAGNNNRDYGNISYFGYDDDHDADDYHTHHTRAERRFEAHPVYGNSRYAAYQGTYTDSPCSLAESPIYLPDGRVERRFVRVCQDSTGQYQVVD